MLALGLFSRSNSMSKVHMLYSILKYCTLQSVTSRALLLRAVFGGIFLRYEKTVAGVVL